MKNKVDTPAHWKTRWENAQALATLAAAETGKNAVNDYEFTATAQASGYDPETVEELLVLHRLARYAARQGWATRWAEHDEPSRLANLFLRPAYALNVLSTAMQNLGRTVVFPHRHRRIRAHVANRIKRRPQRQPRCLH